MHKKINEIIFYFRLIPGLVFGYIRGIIQALVCGAISHSQRKVILTTVFIFLLSFCVRMLHFQDSHVEMESGNTLMTILFKLYRQDVTRIAGERSLLMPGSSVDTGDVRPAIHPPGYPILIYTIYRGDIEPTAARVLILIQIACDSAAACVVFLIAIKLFSYSAGLLAGLLIAISPHFAYYSLWLSPDSLAVLPVLIAVYFIIRKQPTSIPAMIGAGAAIGISCWFRANALMLAPWLAIFCLPFLPRGRKLAGAAAVVITMLAVISPITIRNYLIYHRLIFLSAVTGFNLIQGIGEFDTQGRFGMPVSDKEVAQKDVEWHNRPDYAANVWVPDGLDREHYRLRKGIEVIKENPVWFLGVMVRRSEFMLRYNDSGDSRWPFNSVLVPVVSNNAPYGHSISISDSASPIWVSSPKTLLEQGNALSPSLHVSTGEGPSLTVAGDESEYDDQFTSEPITAEKGKDYVLQVPVRNVEGKLSIKITNESRRITLASKILTGLMKYPRKESGMNSATILESENPDTVNIPFSTGDINIFRIVIANDGSSFPPVISIGEVSLYDQGPTPQRWTEAPRKLIRAIQKNVYKTGRLLPVIGFGIILILLAGRWREFLAVAMVPAYYLFSHSAFSTEYRYILVIHCFLFIFAGVGLTVIGRLVVRLILCIYSRLSSITRHHQIS